MKPFRPKIRTDLKRLAVALLLLLTLLVALVVVNRREPQPLAAQVRLREGIQTVFDWPEDACDERNIPDGPARAFRDARGRVQLIIARQTNYRMVGLDLEHLRLSCNAILSSDGDSRPERFNDREWIQAVYSLDGRTVYALIHNEYQGHRYPGQCPSGNYQQCWYNAVTLAISRDMGQSYSHARPPQHLVAALPYPFEPDSGPAGVFSPSNIVQNPKDGFYYAFVRIARDVGRQPSGTCLMRTDDLSDPASWRAWDGQSFSVTFSNPYELGAGAVSNAEQHICRPVARSEIQLMTDSLTYNTYLDRFVLIGAVSRQQAGGQLVTGIYYAFSDDLIHWTPRALLMEAELPWSFECGDEPPVNYPALIDPQSESRNFDTSGQDAYLYFTRFHVDSCRLVGADLMRMPVEFHASPGAVP